MTWGAISFCRNTGVGGVGLNKFLTKSQAEAAALDRCEQFGGTDCIIQLSFHDQCAVTARSAASVAAASSATADRATSMALAECERDTAVTGSDAVCKITWTGRAERTLGLN